MEELTKIRDKVSRIIDEATKEIKEAVDFLEPPVVYPLNRIQLLNVCAAVAVDAGQTLFGGVLRNVGVALYQVASSQEKDEPKSYAFWVNPNLPDPTNPNEKIESGKLTRKDAVNTQLDKLLNEDRLVLQFVRAMGWRKIYQEGVMQPSCYSSTPALSSFLREILEWAKLYEVAEKLREIQSLGTGIRPVILRDGTLRFGHTSKGISIPLGKLFQDMSVPILGISKSSALLRSPVIVLWLAKYGVYAKGGPFMVRIDTEMFEELGWRLKRYFGEEEGDRFGGYALVRFDPLPGSRNLFAVDIPKYILNNLDETQILLSEVARQSTATSYPVPGYPISLRKVHDKVVFTEDKVYLLENCLRRSLPQEIYELLKNLEIFERSVK
jgi:hypothetical protein